MERSTTTLLRSKSLSVTSAMRSLRHRNDQAPVRGYEDTSSQSLTFTELSGLLHAELAPHGLIEEILVDRIIAAFWVLASEGDDHDPWSEPAMQAEESLCMTLSTLKSLRPDVAVFASTDDSPSKLDDEWGDAWRDRLIMDPDISAESPVVRGTWITVDQVISRIVDGWTWDDLLRAHPELTKDDIRACLAFTVEDENAG